MSSASKNDPHESGGLSFIEQLRGIASRGCSSNSRYWIFGVSVENRHAMIFHPPCKRWSCPECGASNGRRWLARMINGINALGGSWCMVTLTAHEKTHNKGRSVENLRRGWGLLKDRLSRQAGPFAYVLTWEFHESGEFHLHAMFNLEMRARYKITYKRNKRGKKRVSRKLNRWIKDTARQCGMGYQTDVHRIENAGIAAGYVAKYLIKSAQFADKYPSGLRRITVSQNFPQLPNDAKPDFSGYDWAMFQTPEGLARYAQQYHAKGYEIFNEELIIKEFEDAGTILFEGKQHNTVHSSPVRYDSADTQSNGNHAKIPD